jgi:hypothetical protein
MEHGVLLGCVLSASYRAVFVSVFDEKWLAGD